MRSSRRQAGVVLISILLILALLTALAVRDDGEAVVGRSEPGLLDVVAEQVIDEARLARGVVAQDQDDRRALDLALGLTALEGELLAERIDRAGSSPT